MQKVSFSFPDEMVRELDRARGDVSRNQFVLRLLRRSLRDYREEQLSRTTAEAYGDSAFAAGEEALAGDFFSARPEGDASDTMAEWTTY